MRKEAKKISTMTKEELVALVSSNPSSAESAMHVAHQKGWFDVFASIAYLPNLSVNEVRFLLRRVTDQSHKVDMNERELLFGTILNSSRKDVLELTQDDIVAAASMHPNLAAITFVENKTPPEATYTILSIYKVSEVQRHESDRTKDVLNRVIALLDDEDLSIDNEMAALCVANRLNSDPRDQFATQMASMNIHPTAANLYFEMAENPNIFSNNRTLAKNLAANQNEGFELARQIQRLKGRATTDDAMNKIIEMALHSENDANVEWIWRTVVDQMMSQPSFVNKLLGTTGNGGITPISAFFNRSTEQAKAVLDLLWQLQNKWPTFMNDLLKSDSPVMEELIGNALQNEQLAEAARNLPREFFDNIRLRPEDRQTLEEPQRPVPLDDDGEEIDFMELYSSNTNWYRMSASSLTKEAIFGMSPKDAAMWAAVGIFLGSSLGAVIEKFRVPEQNVLDILADPQIAAEAQAFAESIKQNPQNAPEGVWDVLDKDLKDIQEPEFPTTDSHLRGRMGETDYRILSEVANQYSLSPVERKLLMVIRILENGRPGCELGVGDEIPDHPSKRFEGDHEKSLRLQGEWAAGTIKKRFNGNIKDFAKRYCPVNWEKWNEIGTRLMNSQ